MLNSNKIAYCTLCIFFCFVFYFSVISPPPLVYFTTDENFISDSGVFLLYGNPIRNADWPAAISLWVAYIIIIIQGVLDVIQQFSTGHSLHDLMVSIDKTVVHYLQNRTQFLKLERIVQLLLIGFIYHNIIKTTARTKNVILPQNVKFIVPIILLSFSWLWLFAGVIRPDALGAALFLLVTAKILFTEKFKKADFYIITLLFSLAISQRLLYLLMAPFVLGSLLFLILREKQKITLFLNCILVLLFSFISFFPLLMTNSIMVLKSFFGGITAKSEGRNAYFLNGGVIMETILNPYNWIYILLVLIGIVYFIRKYPYKIVAYLFLGNFIVGFVMILQATAVMSSHTLILNTISMYFAVFGAIFFTQKEIFSLSSLQKAYIICGFSILITIIEIFQFYLNARQSTNHSEVITWTKTLPTNTKLMVDFGEFDYFMTKNDSCLVREIQQFSSNNFQESKVRKMYHWQSTEAIPMVAKTSTFEDENLILAQNKLLLQYAPLIKAPKLDVYYHYVHPEVVASAISSEKAIEEFQKNRYDFIVLKQEIQGKTAYKKFVMPHSDPYFIYKK